MSNSQFKLKNDTLFVLADTPSGIYNAEQLRVISEVAQQDSAFLKVTEDERLGFMVGAEQLASVEATLSSVGVQLRPYQGKNEGSPRSCLGNLCPMASQDALSLSLEVAPLLREKLAAVGASLSVTFNGCSRACSWGACEDIHFVGTDAGYDVYLGGKKKPQPRPAALFQDALPASEVNHFLAGILDVYIANQQEDEPFCDVYERLGLEAFRPPLAPATDKAAVAAPEVPVEEGEGLDLSGDLDLGENPAQEEGPLLTLVADPMDEGVVDAEEHAPQPPLAEPFAEISPEPPEGGPLPELLSPEDEAPQVAAASLETPQEDAPPPQEIEAQSEQEAAADLAINLEDTSPLATPAPVAHEKKATNIFEEDAEGLQTPLVSSSPRRMTLKLVGDMVGVKLANGVEFQIPAGSLADGETVEMELEEGAFFIERVDQKINVKYGELELHVPVPPTSVA